MGLGDLVTYAAALFVPDLNKACRIAFGYVGNRTPEAYLGRACHPTAVEGIRILRRRM